MRVLFLAGREQTYARNEVLLRALRGFAEVDVIAPAVQPRSQWVSSLTVAARALPHLRGQYDLVVVGFYGHVIVELLRRFRRGLRVMGEMMLAAGAEVVHPGVRGFAPHVTSPAVLADLERDGPSRPAAYTAAITHMFGTCRMGRDPDTNVVRPDFRHHAIDGLWIADSSVFPTSLGVNPQIPIMAVAALCARRVLAARS